jgi:carboxypeptidase Taq
LLDHYEPGLTVEKLDKLFGDLRASLVPLVQKIKDAPDKPNSSILERDFDPDKQKEFVVDVLKKIGFNFDAGRLDVSAHPFATGINPGDVRLTTRYYRNNLRSAVFGAIHEGGHGMYEQNISKDLIGTGLCTGASMSIHESQSRFWENIVGRSYGFWKHFYPQLVKLFPESLGDVRLEEFHRAINEVTPSFIRVEADEVTYNLHIMLRYEIEKKLFNGEIEVKDLPGLWNQLMEEYLGITPPNDALGVLQDVHWSFGLFGYFPSYSLGNIYASQITHAMKKDLPNFDQLVENGEFAPILSWLVDKIHRHGKMKDPLDLLREVTGEDVNASYLVAYLEEKVSKIYQL